MFVENNHFNRLRTIHIFSILSASSLQFSHIMSTSNEGKKNGMFNVSLKFELVEMNSIDLGREYQKTFDNISYTTNEKLEVRVLSYLDNHKLFIFRY
jgi:hypothetical protein